jgi:hypothetical protein
MTTPPAATTPNSNRWFWVKFKPPMTSYKSVAAILQNGKDKAPAAAEDTPILFHSNIRGRGYYN